MTPRTTSVIAKLAQKVGDLTGQYGTVAESIAVVIFNSQTYRIEHRDCIENDRVVIDREAIAKAADFIAFTAKRIAADARKHA